MRAVRSNAFAVSRSTAPRCSASLGGSRSRPESTARRYVRSPLRCVIALTVLVDAGFDATPCGRSAQPRSAAWTFTCTTVTPPAVRGGRRAAAAGPGSQGSSVMTSSLPDLVDVEVKVPRAPA